MCVRTRIGILKKVSSFLHQALIIKRYSEGYMVRKFIQLCTKICTKLCTNKYTMVIAYV